MKKERIYVLALFLILFFFEPQQLLAQREFTMNSKGCKCNVKYLCYAPNDNYILEKRPMIFILTRAGQTLMESFENDSLKSQLNFHNYLFFYIPVQGSMPSEKLYCIFPISSLVTLNYSWGYKNLFLQINDAAITENDIDKSGLRNLFNSILIMKDSGIISVNDTSGHKNSGADIISSFKQTVIYDDIEQSEEEPEYDEPVIKKTFFGPPRNFNFTVTGIVRDHLTGESLPFASVRVKGTTIGVSTNADGYFTLVKVPTDTTTLLVQYMGYKNTESYLTPYVNKKSLLIEMSSSAQKLNEVVVSEHRDDVELIHKNDISTVKMTPRKFEQLPSLGEKDIMRSFQLMPGIGASNESSSGLYVRGGTPDQNLIQYDGFTIYHVDHLYGFFSAFNSNAIKDVQLYKGGFESRFGGRLSSVTEISGKEGNQKKFNMGADLNLLSFNAFVEIPIGKKFNSIVAYRRSYKGPIYNYIFKKFNIGTSNKAATTTAGPGGRGMNQQESTITSYFYDFNAKTTYKPTDKDILSYSLFTSTDKLDNSMDNENSMSDFSMSSTDLTRYGNIGSSLKWSRKWAQKLYGNTIFSYSNYFSERDRSQENSKVNSDGETETFKNGILEVNNLKDYSFKTDYQYDISNFSQLQFGAFATYFDIKYSYAQNDTLTILDRADVSTLSGIYCQNKLSFMKDVFQFLPGVRMSYYEGTNKVYTEPRLSMTVNLTKRLSLKGAGGKYYQFANRVTREDIMSGSRDFWILSDGVSIPVSSAIHYIAGISYENPNFLASVEGYYKELNNLSEYSLRFNVSPEEVDYNENFFIGEGFAKGVEFLFQRKAGDLNGWVSYTLGKTMNHFDMYSTEDYYANQDVTHEFKFVGMYKYKRWDFALTWIFATGRPYTAPSGAYDVELLDGNTQEFFTVTSKNSLRLPNYHRCDISANYKLYGGDKKKHEIGYIGFSIFNLYNRKNVWYKQFNITDGVITETNINYMGITPNITLSLKLR